MAIPRLSWGVLGAALDRRPRVWTPSAVALSGNPQSLSGTVECGTTDKG